MSKIEFGFSRMDVTPPLGIHMAGYFEARLAQGVLDPLLVSALAVSDGENRAVVLSLDVLGIDQKNGAKLREGVAERTGLSPDAIFYACTHTHTGPVLCGEGFPTDELYREYLFRKIADAAALALEDLRPGTVGMAQNILEDVAFVRRFRMKNGKTQTNPGFQNPEIAYPVGEPDKLVQLLRIRRDDAPEILMVNFQVHPDVIGGCKYSADYPHFVRDTLEAALPNVRCIYLNGAQGDTNHIDVRKTKDEGAGGYEHAMHMGRAVAGAVLQVYGKEAPLCGGSVGFMRKTLQVPSNRGDAAQIPEAERIKALHEAGRRDEILFSGMEYTTVIAEAYRILRLADAPGEFPLEVSAVRFGDAVISGIPGEPFTDIGRFIRKGSPFAATLVCCCAGGYEGYYPTQSAYDEGGYEARSSNFRKGVGERLGEGTVEMLKELKR